MEENRKTNFFVCFTPLHVLLAQGIVERELVSLDYFLYISENISVKNKRYFTILSRQASWSHYFRKAGVITNILSVIKLFIRLSNSRKSIDTFYVSNIKTIYSRIFLWFLSPKRIVTFDDGIGNIAVELEGIPRSYFADTSENKWSRLFFSLVGSKFLYKNLIERVDKHYTIYKLPNIFKNAEYIDMFHSSSVQETNRTRLTILLTNALALELYMSEIEETDFYDKLVDSYKVDLIIRHPRNESYVPKREGCVVSDSLDIAEHQILNMANKYDLEVVSVFYSSVLVHIPIEIKKINIVTKNTTKDRPELRRLHDFLNIPTVDFDLAAPQSRKL